MCFQIKFFYYLELQSFRTKSTKRVHSPRVNVSTTTIKQSDPFGQRTKVNAAALSVMFPWQSWLTDQFNQQPAAKRDQAYYRSEVIKASVQDKWQLASSECAHVHYLHSKPCCLVARNTLHSDVISTLMFSLSLSEVVGWRDSCVYLLISVCVRLCMRTTVLKVLLLKVYITE